MDRLRWADPSLQLGPVLMAAVRAAILGLGIVVFLMIGVPLHWLAHRCGWRLAGLVPVFFHRMVGRILRLRIRYYGVPSVRRPQLIVPNHVSWLDILVVGAHQPVCFLAKQEVAAWPVFGALARLTGAVFVDRSRRMAVRAVNQKIAQRMAAGDRVVLFAEATTGDGNRILKFHSAHFEAARLALPQSAHAASTVLQPVAISYVRREGLPLAWSERASVAWYGDMDLVPHVWALLKAGSVECEVQFGTPIPFLLETDRKAAARRVGEAVRQLTQLARRGEHASRQYADDAVAVLISAEKT
jgi:1-acyl-sn-glycerol-3-phosphate acyltransferase